MVPKDQDLRDALDALRDEQQEHLLYWKGATLYWRLRWRKDARRWKRNWLWTFGALQLALAWIIWWPVVDWLIGR